MLKAGFLIASLMLLMFFMPHASAMGPQPSSCNDLYYATIRSALITYPSGTLDPLAHPNSTIDIQNGQSYTLTFVIRTAPMSTHNDTLPGTFWIGAYEIIFWENFCVAPNQGGNPVLNSTVIGPSMSISVTFNNLSKNTGVSSDLQHSIFAVYSQGMSPAPRIEYDVQWGAVTTSSTSQSESASTTTSSSSSTQTTTPTAIASSPSSSLTTTTESSSSSTTHNIPEFGAEGLILSVVLVMGAALVLTRVKWAN